MTVKDHHGDLEGHGEKEVWEGVHGAEQGPGG